MRTWPKINLRSVLIDLDACTTTFVYIALKPSILLSITHGMVKPNTSFADFQALVAVRRVLLAQYTAFPISGADLYQELLSSTAILSTASPRFSPAHTFLFNMYIYNAFHVTLCCFVFSLDKLLDSGLYTGEITELTGSPGSGKTQVTFRNTLTFLITCYLILLDKVKVHPAVLLSGIVRTNVWSVTFCVSWWLCRCVSMLRLI